MKDIIKSPLNYTGNKYRIFKDISQFFPKKINCMIDLFCGGATVGLNVDANKVIFVDNNQRVINLLIYLSKQEFTSFLSQCEDLINAYNLSYSYKYGYQEYRKKCLDQNDNNGLKDYNSNGFYKLREDYNHLKDKNTDNANLMLYILMVYAFNNDIRFNSECMSFTEEAFKKYVDMADFIYMDPPYLIGNAVYNNSWDYKMEYKLLDFIDSLMERRISFALSNVIEKVGKVNEPLSYWCHKNEKYVSVNRIDYNYRSASYNKVNRNSKEQEVLVVNKEYK